MKILITGGAGFIGSHLVEKFLETGHTVAIMDNFTYAADMNFVQSLNNVTIFKGDIADRKFVFDAFAIFNPTGVIHLAAESHVDNSITNPGIFVKTNVVGTQNLLDAFHLRCHGQNTGARFHHVSTDEVFGHLELGQVPFNEKTPYDPRSPYSASKAASDMLVRAYVNTYGIDAVITNCSNNFGPRQHDEKLIPTVVRSLMRRTDIPVYGKGENIRDWLYVKDHVEALYKVFYHGTRGDTYCIGGKKELPNIEIIRKICTFFDSLMVQELNSFEQLVRFVEDRPGHDFRYSVDPSKIENELQWHPHDVPVDFDGNLYDTVKWYVNKYSDHK
jgi:dTDP-glucose 4,6-dehydratase